MNYAAVDGIIGAVNSNAINAVYALSLMAHAQEDIHALEPNHGDMQKLLSDNAALASMVKNRPNASIDVVTSMTVDTLSTLSGLDPFSRFKKLRERLERENANTKERVSVIKKHLSSILQESTIIIWSRIQGSPEIQRRARSLKKVLATKRRELFSWFNSSECEAIIEKHYLNPRLVCFAINPYLQMEYQCFRKFIANVLNLFNARIEELSADLSGFLRESKRIQVELCEAAKNSLEAPREVRRDSRFFVRRYKPRIREVIG